MSCWNSRRDACLIFVALLIVVVALPGRAGAVYEKIRVPYPLDRPASDLFFHPDLEFMNDDDGAYILLSRPELTQGLRDRGFEVDVLVPDLEAFYAERSRLTRDYGIWHTYAETVAEMNLLHSQYPNLTTAPSSIATTGESRTVWAMKISDNPGVQENEPEVLFDGMHHAREIMTVEDILHFMRYLCENYAGDPSIRFLVDNRQIWFVPLLNVDGFVYNEQTNPNGGGMWRKNRRLNTGGCYGVDLNRNYPYQWVGSGSSTDPCSDTYRGPSERSEPEIAGLTAFINAHSFTTWQSYHSVAGMILFPWGYTSAHTPDDALFRTIAAQMASQNGYQTGQAPELLYTVNGGACDWGYGATGEHAKIFSFTTEIAGIDFWPLTSLRDALIAENLASNIYLCQIAGAYLALNSLTVTGGDGNGRLDAGETCSLVATVGNPALLVAAANARVSVICNDPYVTLTDAQSNLGNIAPGGSVNNSLDPFDLVVAAGCPAGRAVTFTVRLEADGGLRVDETRSFNVGQLPVWYSDAFETPGSEWFTDPSHNATLGAFVRVDPVGTGYQPGDDTTPAPGVNAWITAQNPDGADGIDDVDGGTAATRSRVINLSGAVHAQLDMNYFHGQRDPGDDPGDGFRIDISNDNGGSWVNLVQVGDVNYQAIWRNLKVDIESVLPLTAQMLLRVQAMDPGGSGGTGDVVEGGIDDVYIYDAGSGNQPPSAPVVFAPPDGAGGQPANPTLTVTNAVDPEGQALTYSFRVYSDALLTQVVASVDGVTQGVGTTSWTVTPALANGTLYWRAYAADAWLYGAYCAPASFTVTGGSVGVASSIGAEDRFTAGPNPSAGPVRLRYYAPAAPYAKLDVYDSAGRVVQSLEGPRWSEGWQEVGWDGRDREGHAVPAGVYHVRLVLPTETRTVRVVQIK
jgi:hypothetical protein